MSKVQIVNDGAIAVFACDPGETTGIAAGFYAPHATLKATLTKGRLAHKTTEVRGAYIDQGHKIAALMWRFQFAAQVEHMIPRQNIHYVFEDFVLRRKREGGATGNLTSCWVAAAATALYFDKAELITDYLSINWQQPSEAKFYKDKLREYGLWVPGSEHERDANLHVICRLSKVLP